MEIDKVSVALLAFGLVSCATVPDPNNSVYSLAAIDAPAIQAKVIDRRTPVEPSETRVAFPDTSFNPSIPELVARRLAATGLPGTRQDVELLEGATEIRRFDGNGPPLGLVYLIGASGGVNIAGNVLGNVIAQSLLKSDIVIFETRLRVRIGEREYSSVGIADSRGIDREKKARESIDRAIKRLVERIRDKDAG